MGDDFDVRGAVRDCAFAVITDLGGGGACGGAFAAAAVFGAGVRAGFLSLPDDFDVTEMLRGDGGDCGDEDRTLGWGASFCICATLG